MIDKKKITFIVKVKIHFYNFDNYVFVNIKKMLHNTPSVSI